MTSKPYIKRIAQILLFGLIATLLLVSLASFWIRTTIFDTATFTRVATDSIAQQSSRDAIGRLVTNRALEQYPTINALAGDRLAASVSSLLASDLAARSITTVVSSAQSLLVSPAKPPIEIDLRGIKTTIVTLQSAAGDNSAVGRIDSTQLPDTVTLIDTSGLPNFYNVTIVLLWLGPLTLLSAIILSVIWILKAGTGTIARRILIMLGLYAATGLVARAAGPIIEPVFISIARDADSQSLLGALYSGFIAPFNTAAVLLAVVAGSLFVLLFVAQFLYRRYSISVHITRKNLGKK